LRRDLAARAGVFLGIYSGVHCCPEDELAPTSSESSTSTHAFDEEFFPVECFLFPRDLEVVGGEEAGGREELDADEDNDA
jgi:hypothetical protein